MMMRVHFLLSFLIIIQKILAFQVPYSLLIRHVNHKESLFPHMRVNRCEKVGNRLIHFRRISSSARFFKGSPSKLPLVTEDDLIRQEVEERRKKEEEEKARVSGALDDLFDVDDNENPVDFGNDITPLVLGDDRTTIVTKVKRPSSPARRRKQKEEQSVVAPQPFDLSDVEHKEIFEPEKPVTVKGRRRKVKVGEPVLSTEPEVDNVLHVRPDEPPSIIQPSISIVQPSPTNSSSEIIIPVDPTGTRKRVTVKSRPAVTPERVPPEKEIEPVLPIKRELSSLEEPYNLPAVEPITSKERTKDRRSKLTTAVKQTVSLEGSKTPTTSKNDLAMKEDVISSSVNQPYLDEEITGPERARIIEYRRFFNQWYDTVYIKIKPEFSEDKRIEILAFSLPERERFILYDILRDEYKKEKDSRNRRMKELKLLELQQKISDLKEDQVGREEQEDIFYEIMESQYN
jgi:hypothetical protein